MVTEDQLVQIEKTRKPARIESKCGVYFLLNGIQVVYVGQSEDIEFRIKTHLKEGSKYFDHYQFFECERHLLDLMEAYFIWLYQPELNKFIPINQDKFCVLFTYLKTRNIDGKKYKSTLKQLRSMKRFWSIEELDFYFKTR